MNGRILVDVSSLFYVVAGNDESEAWLVRSLRGVADEINSALDGWECSLVFLDTGSYLSFVRRDPDEGAFWDERRTELEAEHD